MPINLLYVSDAKAGHRSQALGLYHAYQRLNPHQTVQWTEITIDELSYVHLLWAKQKITPAPDYIIGVGSHTHLKVALLGKCYPQAKTIILMKTSLPFSWFDYHLIPEHDKKTIKHLPKNIIFTQGALNPIVNQHRHQQGRILIALGGSSKRHHWDNQAILTQLKDIIQRNANTEPSTEIILTTSRRTPSDFLTAFKAYLAELAQHNVQIFPVEDTPQGWIFEQMQLAETVWVSEDSVSMIFEALTAGAKVGILAVQRLKQDRITQLLDELLQQAQPFEMKLNEAERVARLIFGENKS